MIFDSLNNEWVQIAVVSWGYGCAAPYYYGVYARLTEFAGWIDSHAAGLLRARLIPTPTPTSVPVPTTTPVPPAGGDLSIKLLLPVVRFSTDLPLLNGSFENGIGGGWQMRTLRAPRNIWTEDELSSNPLAHSGRLLAWLGGEDYEVSIIEQTVTVPRTQPVLNFWLQSRSEDTCGYDYAGVVVNDTVIRRFDLCEANNRTTWQQVSVNLSTYAGKTVLLQIRAETDRTQTSSFFVDDVAWQGAGVSEAAAPGVVATPDLVNR
jgi:hypothetical protein